MVQDVLKAMICTFPRRLSKQRTTHEQGDWGC